MRNHSENASLGVALECNESGVVTHILHNASNFADTQLLGMPVTQLFSTSSTFKAMAFLSEVRGRGAAFNWELDLILDERVTLAHCAGLFLPPQMLILIGETHGEIRYVFDELMRMNNEQANLLRDVTKSQADLMRSEAIGETDLYNELTRVNNSLMNLQRELSRKNAELERLNAEVARLATVDELTQVYNRRGFFEIGQREVERAIRFGTPLTALMLDIDHFKRFNDTYGHAAGDRVLREVAARCAAQLRTVDVFGRYGGEEFVALLPALGADDARNVAERVRLKVGGEPIQLQDASVQVTTSVGVAVLQCGTVDLAALLEQADQALYRAKESGRNRVCVACETNA